MKKPFRLAGLFNTGLFVDVAVSSQRGFVKRVNFAALPVKLNQSNPDPIPPSVAAGHQASSRRDAEQSKRVLL